MSVEAPVYGGTEGDSLENIVWKSLFLKKNFFESIEAMQMIFIKGWAREMPL